jgi:hypothetical protein
MKRTVLVSVLVGVLALAACGFPGAAAAGDNAVSTGAGQGIVIDNPTPDDICPASELLSNDDGSYENGYAWAYAGEAVPYYGAWAEGFDYDTYNICGMKFGLTQTGNQDGWLMDVYVWDHSGANPDYVLDVTTGVNPGTVATWPSISQHDVDIQDVWLNTDRFFVGWWGDWVDTANGWYVASDENGFGGGLPRTNIAPGVGFPTGWNHPNVVSTFAGCMDLAIGVYVGGGEIPPPDPPNPVRPSSWGSLKALFD